MGAMVQASQLGVAKIIHFGDDEQQKSTGCPGSPTGDVPADHRGHRAGVRRATCSAWSATAVRDGDDYILNGRKVFVGNSHVGDLHGVVVRTGPGSKGLTAFLVESDRPGFSLGAAAARHGPARLQLRRAASSTTAACRRPTGSARRVTASPSPTPPACCTGGPT